jgi:glycosyltransferase involved in cell wall biosynthesis
MKILVISNLYPPFFMGGYELGCQDVVEGLKKRGHEVSVLTSTYGINKVVQDDSVYRIFSARFPLRLYRGWKLLYFIPLLISELNDWKRFLHSYRRFSPDIIYIWNGLGLSYSLLLKIQKLDVPIVFYIFEHWLTKIHENLTPEGFSLYHEPWIGFWMKREKNILMKIAKKILGFLLSLLGFTVRFEPFPLRNVHYACEMLKEDALRIGLPVKNSKVIYYGLNLDEGPFSTLALEPPRSRNEKIIPLKLLYVGNLLNSKGAHTLIKACSILALQGIDFSVTLAGKKLDKKYYDELKQTIDELGLTSKVRFELNLSREDLNEIYKDHHILIIPSIWKEPMGLVLLEGMIAGIPIIHTGVGGTKEVLKESENCLLFPPENHERLVEQIARLVKDRDLYSRLSVAGKNTVIEKYNLSRTLDEIEEDLEKILYHKSDISVK